MHMGKLYVFAAVVFAALRISAAEEMRPFESADGRVIEARVISYDAAEGKIQLELANGKKGWMPINAFSEQDRIYVEQWRKRSAFHDPQQFALSLREESDGWERDERSTVGRKTKTSHFFLTLENQGGTDLKGLRMVYIVYRHRKGGINTYVYEKEVPDVAAGRSHDMEFNKSSSYKTSTGFINEVNGVRARVYWTAPDGAEIFREITLPNDLDPEAFVWKDPVDSTTPADVGPQPELDLASKNLSKDQVKALAEKYASAWENHDFELWKGLLEPLHHGDPRLAENTFNLYDVHSVYVKSVDGLNVQVRIAHKGNSRKQDGWLQFHESGHLKYTPMLFRHPLYSASSSVRMLYNQDDDYRRRGAMNLEKYEVPLFGYQFNADERARYESSAKIIDWFQTTGRTHDVGEPKLSLPEEQYEEILKSLSYYANRTPYY